MTKLVTQRRLVPGLITEKGGQRIDTDLLLASGAIEGPARATRPLRRSWRRRVVRVLRALVSFLAAPSAWGRK